MQLLGGRPLPDPPPLVAVAVLEGRFPEDLPRSVAGRIVNGRLLRLAAHEARLDLALAGVLSSFTIADARAAGHSHLEDFARELLGFSWSHARELIGLATKLRTLPVLSKAFASGRLGRSRLRDILRVATPEDEADWLARSRSMTAEELSRQVRARLRPDEPPPARPERRRLTYRVTPEEGFFIEVVGLPMVRAVLGVHGPVHALMGAVAAEVLTEAPARLPDGPPAEKAWRWPRVTFDEFGRVPQMRLWAPSDRTVRQALRRMGGDPKVRWPRLKSDALEDRLALAQELAIWRRALDSQRAALLFHAWETAAWRIGGHETFAAWCDRRLHVAPREVHGLLRLQSSLERLPALRSAWSRGRVTTTQALAVLRVATRATDGEWTAYAQEATDKRLEADVAAHVALRLHVGDDKWSELTGGKPMREQALADLRVSWSEVLRSGAEAERSGPLRAGMPGLAEGHRVPIRRYRDDRTTRSFSFEAPAEVADEFERALAHVRSASAEPLPAGVAIAEMLWRFADVHVLPTRDLTSHELRVRVLRRDGWQCSMPQCRSRVRLEIHHVEYRSHGGGDEEWNLTTFCAGCHRLEHEGNLAARSDGIVTTRAGTAAPRLTVTLGSPHLPSLRRTYREGLRVA